MDNSNGNLASESTLLIHKQELVTAQNERTTKPLVKGAVKGLTFDVLLDACSTGPEGYIVNYIHPDAVIKIREHQQKTKTPIIHKCSCTRAQTCTAAGCFESTTKILFIRS